MKIPQELKYTRDHEWLRVEGEEATVGITDYAQEALGGVVFVELPALGARLTAGAIFGAVESNKAVSDLFAPVGGEVIAINAALSEQPEAVNDDPYGEGWMLRLRVENPGAVDDLLDAAGYTAHVSSEQGT